MTTPDARRLAVRGVLHHNPFLPPGATTLDVVLRLTPLRVVAPVDLRLEVHTTSRAAVRSMVRHRPGPTELALTGTPRARQVGLGTWSEDRGEEVYHLGFDVDAPAEGSRRPGTMPDGRRVLAERLLVRLTLSATGPAGEVAAPVVRFRQRGRHGAHETDGHGHVVAFWTEDPVAVLLPDPTVATVVGSTDLVDRLREGLLAWQRGRHDLADTVLREVHRRSGGEGGDRALHERLGRLYDERSGTFRLEAREQLGLEESTATTALD